MCEFSRPVVDVAETRIFRGGHPATRFLVIVCVLVLGVGWGCGKNPEATVKRVQEINKGYCDKCADQLIMEALQLSEQPLDPTHLLAVAVSLTELANKVGSQNMVYSGRSTLLERALQIREQVLGPTHPDVAVTLTSLAKVVVDPGRKRTLLERALQIREKALGPTHPDVAVTLTDLAKLYLYHDSIGEKYKEDARPFLERALQIREQALSPTHPDLAKTLTSLGVLYNGMGDRTGARSLAERAFPIWAQVQVPQSRDEALDMTSEMSITEDLLKDTGSYELMRTLRDKRTQLFKQAERMKAEPEKIVICFCQSPFEKRIKSWPAFIIGVILYGVGSLWIVVIAFRQSFLWALACFFIPVVNLLYGIKEWDQAKVPVVLSLIGAGLFILSGARPF